jgi:hypothetical protein
MLGRAETELQRYSGNIRRRLAQRFARSFKPQVQVMNRRSHSNLLVKSRAKVSGGAHHADRRELPQGKAPVQVLPHEGNNPLHASSIGKWRRWTSRAASHELLFEQGDESGQQGPNRFGAAGTRFDHLPDDSMKKQFYFLAIYDQADAIPLNSPPDPCSLRAQSPELEPKPDMLILHARRLAGGVHFSGLGDEQVAHLRRVFIFPNPPMISAAGQIYKLEARMPVWREQVSTTTQRFTAMCQGGNLRNRFIIEKPADHLGFTDNVHASKIPNDPLGYQNNPE